MTEQISRAALCVVACCVLAGCGTDAEPVDDQPAIDAATAAADSITEPGEDLVTLPTNRIYYTLTSHDWYARGEPLVHNGRPYEPDGMPVHASLTAMTKAGDYQGVEYYTLDTDPDAAVYVPVFDGYWQRFLADPNAVAVPADAPAGGASDAAAPDSGTALH
ncbi:MAG TPA: hypothetical protein VHG09_03450 [Longimicrobiales bacterium]|nr:hypothetical protein [Longimicrobiales bacterium]